jgi:hypothetical protein
MTTKVCDVLDVRVIAFVVVALGLAAPAHAEIDASKIEQARSSALSPTFQEDLPGYEYVLGPGEGGEPGEGGLERGGPATQGSGSAGKIKPASDPRKADRRQGQRDSARRAEDRVDTREQPREEEGGVSDIMTMFMWGLVAVAVGLLLFWFISEMGKGDSDKALPAEADEQDVIKAATAAIIDRPLSDADELAARGMYAEAIHTLLLKTLHELARNAMVRIEHSHTSREILRRVQLSPDPRDALGVLITYVELTHFGDEPAGNEDYARCREQFHVFASAFRAGLALASPTEPNRLGGGTSLAS